MPSQVQQTLMERLDQAVKRRQDVREAAIDYVRGLARYLPTGETAVVVFFAPPYCPYNTLRHEIPAEHALRDRLEHLVDEFAGESGESYEVRDFFPSLSDSSYLKIDDTTEAMKVLKENFPQMERLYPLPLEKIQRLDIPAVNFGCYGRDAHKWSERVYKPYSFQVLPELILKTVQEFLA